MCGDLDDEDGLEAALYARFRAHARTLLKGRSDDPAGRAEPTSAYMDRLFADALARCLRDGDDAEESRRYDMLAAQPIVLARLAGFLAAHASLREDPLRKVIEALMHGYAEAERIEPDHGHDHDDEHGHDHHAHAHHHQHDHHH
ncbi:MAG: hypothetical protein M3453_11570 [Pseudomonadota bacterium]|nr:hypothetical protein [Pseudomonadota bacterium]